MSYDEKVTWSGVARNYQLNSATLCGRQVSELWLLSDHRLLMRTTDYNQPNQGEWRDGWHKSFQNSFS